MREWSPLDSWVFHLFFLFWAPTEILHILSAQRCLSVCETLMVVCYLQGIFLARGILQSPSENCSLEELWVWYKPLNLSRWVCFQQGHRISSHLLRWGDEWIQLSCILSVPSLKWIAELINSLPFAPASSPNWSFFQSSSGKCHSTTASVSWEAGCNKPRHVPQPGRGDASPAAPWTARECVFRTTWVWGKRESVLNTAGGGRKGFPPLNCWSVDTAAGVWSWCY